MQDFIKGLERVWVDDICCSSFVYQCNHPVIVGLQIGQAQSVLSEAKLTFSFHLLVLHETYYKFQKNLLHDLPRLVEAHWPAVLWVIFFSLLKNGINVFLFPVAGDFN